ncbi:MAG: ATP-binding protein [Myxococcota bacterium]
MRLVPIGTAKLPLRELLRGLVEQACALTRARYGALGVLDGERGGFRDFVHVGLSDEEVRRIGHPPEGRGLIGAVIREGRPIRVPEASRDARASGLPPHHPPVRSFLGVPLRIGDRVFGNFYLANKRGRDGFTKADERRVVELAEQAALAVGYAEHAELADERGHLLDAILRQAPDGILFFDAPDGDLVMANAAAARIFGRPVGHEPLSERPRLYGFRHPDGRGFRVEELPAWRALRGQTVVNEEFRIDRPDGSSVHCHVSATPVRADDDGALLGAAVVFQDVTAFRDLARLREEFAAVVAHDLRNPMATIHIEAERLLRRPTGSDGAVAVPRPSLERILRASTRLHDMVDDLLDVARIESGRIALDRAAVSLAVVLPPLVDQMQPTLGSHVVEVRVAADMPPVLIDRLRVEQVLANLIGNAAKYSPEGAPIRVSVEVHGDGATIAVRDEGVGIEPEEMRKLFDRFYQSKRAREMKSGLGLGLYIVKGLVEAHGGRITVESVPGRGSTFRVWLPTSVPVADTVPVGDSR